MLYNNRITPPLIFFKSSKYLCTLYAHFPATIERFRNVSAPGEPNENNTNKYIVMECKNDPTGGAPYWDPLYDHKISPFPSCITLRK